MSGTDRKRNFWHSVREWDILQERVLKGQFSFIYSRSTLSKAWITFRKRIKQFFRNGLFTFLLLISSFLSCLLRTRTHFDATKSNVSWFIWIKTITNGEEFAWLAQTCKDSGNLWRMKKFPGSRVTYLQINTLSSSSYQINKKNFATQNWQFSVITG